jgi:hypothetical protein
MKRRILLFLSLTLTLSSYSQETIEVQNNRLRASLSSNGALANSNDQSWLSYEQDGDLISLVYQAGLWLGGINEEGNLFVADTRDGGLPGPQLEFPGSGQTEIIPYNKVWTVTAEEIADHIADFEDNGVIDNPQVAVFGWPGRGNPFFNDYYPDIVLNQTTVQYAQFLDVNGTATYEPDQGEYPILGIRGCYEGIPIIPTAMHWTMFSILDSNTDSVIIDVAMTLFYFGCEEEEHPLSNTMFVQYTLFNGLKSHTDVYLGQFLDPDLGCPFDDYSGSFPERHTAYVYNADNNDEACNDLPGFGENPPVFAADVYRGPLNIANDTIVESPLSSIISFNNGSINNPSPATADPNNVSEYYNYLQGLWRDGSPLTIGGDGYDGDEETSFSFPGLPEENGQWTEFQENNTPGDRRLLLNFGPFNLVPGAVNEFISSFSVYAGEGNHIEKVTATRDQIDELQAYFDYCFDIENAVGLPPCTLVLTDIEDQQLPHESILLFPNPANEKVEIRAEKPVSRVWIVNATGQQLYHGVDTTINVAHLPVGIYFVGIEIDGKVNTQKLVIK